MDVIFWLVIGVYGWYAVAYFYRVFLEHKEMDRFRKKLEQL